MLIWHESSAIEKKTLTPPLLKKDHLYTCSTPFSRPQKLTLELEPLQTGSK
jgi:hypothetical protein